MSQSTTPATSQPLHPDAKPRLQAYLVHVGNNLRFYRLVAKLTTQMRDLAASLDEFSRLDSDDFTPDETGGEYSATAGMVYDVCEEEMHGLNWTLRHAMDSVSSVLLKSEEELAGLVRKLAKDARAKAATPAYHDPETADGCIELGQYLHNGDGLATVKNSRRSRARSG